MCKLPMAIIASLAFASSLSTNAESASVGESPPLRIVVPYAAGGTTDQVARLLQQPLSKALQRTVIVENKPGAAGTIGTAAVARATPDGNTLVFGNPGPNAILPALRDTGYDPLQDLVPVSTVAIMPMMLVTSNASGIDSFDDFLLQAGKSASRLNYGSSGIGSSAHLTGALFGRQLGVDWLHVPYSGGSPMMMALIQGDLQATFATGLDGAAMVESGKAKYLAVASSKRLSTLPQLPAIGEQIPGFVSEVWFALFAPKGTTANTVQELRKAILNALEQPEIVSYLSQRHALAIGSTLEELTDRVRSDMALWGGIAKEVQALH